MIEQLKHKNRRLKGFIKPVLYFDDLETFTDKSFYFKEFNDTKAYLVCSLGLKLIYDKETKQYKNGEPFLKKAFKDDAINDYFNFYLNFRNVTKYKLGYHQIHYFHNGKNFDFYFLLFYLLKLDTVNLVYAETEANQDGIFLFVNWSDAYKSFSVIKKSGKNYIKLEFRDNLYLFPNTSIKMLGQSLNFPKLDLEANTENVEKTGIVDDDVVYYCFRDCEIMLKNFLNYLPFLPNGSKIPLTVGSWGRQIFLHDLNPDPNVNKFNEFRALVGISKREQQEINNYFIENKIYKGGLTTFNDSYRLKILNNIYVEDVVSQYPHKMVLRQPFGKMLKLCYPQIPYYDVVFIKKRYINIRRKNDRIPNYLHIPNSFIQYVNSAPEYVIFETKQFIKEFEKLHDFDDVEILEVVGFESTPSYFSNYINHFIELKNTAAKNSPERNFAKLMLNCLYGKLAQNEIIEKQIFKQSYLKMTDNGSNFENVKFQLLNEDYKGSTLPFVNVLETNPSPFTFLHIASWITSLARAYLLKRTNEIINRGGVVYYHDTDSNFFYLENMNGLKFGKELGNWDYDCETDFYKHGYILGSKKYLLFEHQGEYFKDLGHFKLGSAGVPQKVIEQNKTTAFFNNEPFKIKIKKFTKSGIILIESSKFLINDKTFAYLMLG